MSSCKSDFLDLLKDGYMNTFCSSAVASLQWQRSGCQKIGKEGGGEENKRVKEI